MNGLTIIIPSRNWRNIEACIDSICALDDLPSILVVDDSPDASIALHINHSSLPLAWEDVRQPAFAIPGVSPFIFSRNINLAIKHCFPDDVIILNDDTVLETPFGFSMLQAASIQFPQYGIVSAACNGVGNTNQFRQNWDKVIRDEPRMVCFVAAFVPRSTIYEIGLLDERFVDYGLEDDDYCLRARQAGLQIGIFDGCFVDHTKLESTSNRDFRPNLDRFIEKWGAGNMDL